MRPYFMCLAALCAAASFSACSGSQSVLTPKVSATPTVAATATPTSAPAATPTAAPTATPTVAPTATPTVAATATATPPPGATATPTPKPTGTPTLAPTATPTPAPTAQPQVVHIGFNHNTSSSAFGDVAYYTGTSGANDPASVITVLHGSKLVFESDSSQPPHTASGFGTGGFPTSFDNTGGTTSTGTTIDGGTSWSTGTLESGDLSQVFTVGPAGDYYFGCFYHYGSSNMRDVIVSQ